MSARLEQILKHPFPCPYEIWSYVDEAIDTHDLSTLETLATVAIHNASGTEWGVEFARMFTEIDFVLLASAGYSIRSAA